MIAQSRALSGFKAFLVDYIERHRHPVNAILHIVGVPLAFFGLFAMLAGGKLAEGAVCLIAGYFLQYLGHRAQGNEVGEVTLIKWVFRRLTGGVGRHDG